MKQPAKTTEQPKAVDALIAIVELVTPIRFPSRTPTLADLARLVSAASRVLHIRDHDARVDVENAAVMVLAKKRGMVS